MKRFKELKKVIVEIDFTTLPQLTKALREVHKMCNNGIESSKSVVNGVAIQHHLRYVDFNHDYRIEERNGITVMILPSKINSKR